MTATTTTRNTFKNAAGMVGRMGARDGDAHGDPAHETYHLGLRNQHAMEMSAIELCKRQAERMLAYPEMRARLLQHLMESEEQGRRLEAIMQRHGTAPSGLKTAWTSVMGNIAAALHIPAADEVLKNSFADYAFEHFEIAAYSSLIAMAETVGDIESIPVLQQCLAEEKAMSAFLESQIEPVTKRYLGLARDKAKGDGLTGARPVA